ncbi:MAG: hypothetical protein ABR503_11275 [Chitinophagaceae bacterium]
MKWLSSAFLFSTEKNGAFDTATMDKAAVIKHIPMLTIMRYLPIRTLANSK